MLLNLPTHLWLWLTQKSLERAKETGERPSRTGIIHALIQKEMEKGE